MPTSELPSGGILRVRVTEDLELDGGTWELTGSRDRQSIARMNGQEEFAS